MVTQELKGLKSSIFEHPSDAVILSKAKAIPLINKLIGKLVDKQKRELEIALIASSIRVTPQFMPELYTIYERTCKTLTFKPPYPELYIENKPTINAETIGCDKAYICITQMAVDSCSERELMYLFGHELGHVMAGHVRYGTLVRILISIGYGSGLMSVLGDIAKFAVDFSILPLLLFWNRRSEFTADRAGLLACQDKDAVRLFFMKIAGLPQKYQDSITNDIFMQQIKLFEECLSHSVSDNIYALKNIMTSTHPFIVERISQLQQWIDDGSYDDIIDASEAERIIMAENREKDPLLAELIMTISRTISCWYVKEYKTDPKETACAIRKVLHKCGGLKGSCAENLMRIELLVEKTDINELAYYVLLLVLKDSKAMKVKLALTMSTDWDEAPGKVRSELIRTGMHQATWLLYNVM